MNASILDLLRVMMLSYSAVRILDKQKREVDPGTRLVKQKLAANGCLLTRGDG